MKQCVIVINLALITGLAYWIIKTGYDVAAMSLAVSPAPIVVDVPIKTVEIQGQQQFQHYQSIEQRNLFKTKNTTEPTVVKEPEPVETPIKKTNLNLRLWGTIVGDSSVARAIIEDKTRKQTLLKEGDYIEQATIKKVLWNSVILSVNGRDEVLEIQKLGEAVRQVQPGPPPVQRPELRTAPPPAMHSAPGVRSQNIAVARTEIDDAAGNINEIMRQARFRPHFRDGQPSGLTITNIQPDSIFTRLGLQSGDIILGVDGQEIKTVDDALKFYTGLRSSGNLQLKIRRRGLERTLDYNIE